MNEMEKMLEAAFEAGRETKWLLLVSKDDGHTERILTFKYPDYNAYKNRGGSSGNEPAT